MANLIITVISIALVAVAALMGAYYGGGAFMNGAAQADANRIIKQADQIQAAWSLQATYNGGIYQTVAVSDLATGGKYLTEVPAPSDKISSDTYTFIKLADNTTTDGLTGIRLNLKTTDSARKVCMAISKTAAAGDATATPKKLASGSDPDRTPTGTRKFDCLFSGSGSVPVTGDPMIFIYNVGAPSSGSGGGGGGGSASVAAAPSSLTFSTATSTASATQVVTITNSGAAEAASLSVAFTTGTNFTKSTTCGATLAASASCTVSVNSNSIATAGTYTDTLNVTYTGGSASVGLSATVTGGGGACTVSGAGEAPSNGAYTAAGMHNGKPYYTNGNGRYIFWKSVNVTVWILGNSLNNGIYYSSVGGNTCPIGSWIVWDNQYQFNPTPTTN